MKNTLVTPASRKARDPKLCCINRLRKRGKVGWRVMTHRTHPPRSFQKFFADHLHGGRAATLAVAQAWRDQIMLAHPRFSKAALSTLLRKHNTSGIPGVYRKVQRKSGKQGKVSTHVIWQAQTPLCVIPFKSKSFSVAKFGEAEAFQLAVAARKTFEADL